MERLICQCCGENLRKDADGYKCVYCGALYQEDQAEKTAALLQGIIDDFKLEQLANARRRLYESTHQKYPSAQEVKLNSSNVLSLRPEDFLARIYLHSHDADPHDLILTLARENVSLGEAREAFKWLLRSLDSRLIGALKDFVDRHFEGKEKTNALNAIEDEAYKLDSGVYDLSLKRDVFLCYSAADMPRVIVIMNLFEENGLSCFAAFRNLRHGKGAQENYQDAIFTAMKNAKVFVFLSSNSSRSPQRKGVAEELDHLATELKNKPRVEFLLEDYPERMPILAKRRLEAVFPHLEYCRDEDDLILRVSGLLDAEENAEKEKAKKIAEEAAAKAKKELQAEFEAKEAERRKKEQEREEALAKQREEHARKEKELEQERLRIEKEKLEIEKQKLDAVKAKGATNAVSTQVPDDPESFLSMMERAERLKKEKEEAERKRKIEEEKRRQEEERARKEEEQRRKAQEEEKLRLKRIEEAAKAIEKTFQIEILPSKAARIVKLIDLEARKVVIPKTYRELPVHEVADKAFSSCPNLEYILVPESLHIGKEAFSGCPKDSYLCLEIAESFYGDPKYFDKDAFKGFKGKMLWGVVDAEKEIAKEREKELQKLKKKALAVEALIHDIKRVDYSEATMQKILAAKKAYEGLSEEERKFVTNFAAIARAEEKYEAARIRFEERSRIKTEELIGAIGKVKYTVFCKDDIDKARASFEALPIRQQKLVNNLDILVDAEKQYRKLGDEQRHALEEEENAAKSIERKFDIRNVFGDAHIAKPWDLNASEVSIPDFYRNMKITAIAKKAFEGAMMTTIKLPENLKFIYERAFYGCKSLVEIAFPVNLHIIYECAFYGCESLQEITFPVNLRSIGKRAFEECSSLKSILVQGNEVSLEDYAFYGCFSLKDVVFLAGKVSLGSHVFEGCTSLETLTLPEGVAMIPNNAFYCCKNLKSIIFPESIYAIDDYAFAQCSALASIPKLTNLQTIGQGAFEGCMCLTEIILPNTLTHIGKGAFYNCRSLKSILIPESVTSIGPEAFRGCPKDCVLRLAHKKPLFGYPKNYDKDFLEGFQGKVIWGAK